MNKFASAVADITALPPIGARFNGGLYAGVCTKPDGQLYALVLLDDKPVGDLSWAHAFEWARGLGNEAELFNRVEGALLFANLPEQFEKRWHWTNEQYSRNGAWGQDFDDGDQDYDVKAYEGRARAVRRFAIGTQSFNPLPRLSPSREREAPDFFAKPKPSIRAHPMKRILLVLALAALALVGALIYADSTAATAPNGEPIGAQHPKREQR